MTQTPRRLSAQTAREVEDLYRKDALGLFQRAIVLTQGRRQEAEDALQEIFVGAALKWDMVCEMSDQRRRKYLATALRNKIIDQWRRKRRDVLVSEFPDPNYGVEDLAAEDAYSIRLDLLTRSQLWRELKALPPQQYRVAYLSWELGWPTVMIAEHLGIQESTVRAMRSFAAARIRDFGLDLRSLGVTDEQDGV